MTSPTEPGPGPPDGPHDHDAPKGRVAILAPLIEGAVLALLVLLVVGLSGDTVRASYEGYLEVSAGQAVLRDGLLPENPYHAGEPLRVPTLYPTLGVLIGKFAGGPLWGFAILNLLAAAFFAPALDSLGRSLKFSTTARRLTFLAALLFFNGLGWLGALGSGDGGLFGAMAVDGQYLQPQPILSLLPLSMAESGFAWDARLQAFLPTFLAVGPLALALPFALLAVAWSLRPGREALLRTAACALPAFALHPVVGGAAALLALACAAPSRLSVPGGRKQLMLVTGGVLLLALPFLLGPLQPGATGESGTVSAERPHDGVGAWTDLAGPLALLLPLGIAGLLLLRGRTRTLLTVAIAACALLTLLPWPADRDKDLVRVVGILLALPSGALLARFTTRRAGWLLPIGLCLLCLPTTVRTFQAYRHWNLSEALPLRSTTSEGMSLVEEKQAAWPEQLALAEQALPDDAVLLIHPQHPGARIGGLMAGLGNLLAPLFHHPMYVDVHQRFNEREPDLQRRQELCAALWTPPRLDGSTAATIRVALAEIRTQLPGRSLAMVVRDRPPADELVLQSLGAELHAMDSGARLWVFPPLPEGGGN